MPAAMFAGFMLPPMEAGPRGPGWFMNWLLYAWVGPIWKEEQTFNGRRRKKKKNKMPHALKVQGGKGGEVGDFGVGWGTLSCVAATGDQAPRGCQPPGLTAALCRPYRKDAAQEVLRGGARSLQCTGICREAGRKWGRGCRGGKGHGRMEVDEDGGRSPFPGSSGPALGPWPMETHTPPIKSDAAPAPTSAHLPCCLHPVTATPVLHSCGATSPPTPPCPSESQGGRARIWAEFTDRLTRRAMARVHSGDKLVTRLF